MRKIDLIKIKVGDCATVEKTMNLSDTYLFACVSCDYNPIHLDKHYAEKSRYRGQIVHGMMVASLFSGLFGMKLPGEGCVYKSQKLKFRRPIYIGETVVAQIEVTSIDRTKKNIVFRTWCLVKDKVAIDGESEIFVP